MKAVGLTKYLPTNDSNSLVDLEIRKPQPTGRDLLVAIKAISVNPIDTVTVVVDPIHIFAGAPKPQAVTQDSPGIFGWDAAGIVEAVGPDATLFKPGDEVYYAGDFTRPGANAEYQLVDERIVGGKPKSLDFAQAAAMPLTSITAYESLFDRLRVDLNGSNRGETLLIIGGAGGVGSIGIQLAKIAGLTVIASASRSESAEWVKSLGADYIVNHHAPLRPQVEALGMSFVDHIAIFNDTDGHWDSVTDLIRPEGSIVSIVGSRKPLDQNLMISKSVTFVWETMFTRSMFKTPDMIEQHNLLTQIAVWIDDGTLQTTLNQLMTPINAENLRKAHELIKTGRSIGKVVLSEWIE